MWTYTPGPLDTSGLSLRLSGMLWPADDSATDPPGSRKILGMLDLTPKDLQDRSIRSLLESEWPQIVERMYIVALLRRPETPFYRLYELQDHLAAFSRHLRSHEDEIIRQGRPSKPFLQSPWLNEGLSNLYPIQSVVDETLGKGSATVVRRELLQAKIGVIDLLAGGLREGDPGDLSKQALVIARGRRSLDGLSQFDAVEDAHFRWLFRKRLPGESVNTGGYADIVSLIAYCEKERTIGTFDNVKKNLVEVLLQGGLIRYVEIAASTQKHFLDEAIWQCQSGLDDEVGFYREFSTKTLVTREVARFKKMIDPESDYIFRFTGYEWRIRWHGGEIVSLPNLEGLKYIEMLLRAPNTNINVLTLYHRANPIPTNLDGTGMEQSDEQTIRKVQDELREIEQELDGELDAQPPIKLDGTGMEQSDEQTIRKVQDQLWKIEQELEGELDAQQRNELEKEKLSLKEYLRETTGLHGEPRLKGDQTEGLRLRITMNIRYAKKKLRARLPEFAEHLDNHLATGKICRYSPRSKIDWAF